MVLAEFKERFAVWKSIFLTPGTGIAAEAKRKAGMAEGLKHLFFAFNIHFALQFLFFALLGLLFAMFAAVILQSSSFPTQAMGFLSAMGAMMGVFAAFYLVAYYFLGLLLLLLLSFLVNAIYFLSARVLGGKGSFTRQFCAISAESSAELAARSMLMLAFPLLYMLPCLGPIIMVLGGLCFYLYDSYLKVRMLSRVHSFSTGRAIVAWAVPLAMFALALLAFSILYLAAIMRALIR